MAILSKQIGWSQESNLLWEILKQLNKLGGLLKPTPPAYKVYSALLTQGGGDNIQSAGNVDGGPLKDTDGFQKGVTYEITANPNNTDLSAYGAPNNSVGTIFVSTVTVNLTDENLDVDVIFTFNTGAPVVKVLENTIGNIWWTYVVDETGTYKANSDGLFTVNKTMVLLGTNGNVAGDWNLFKATPTGINSIEILSGDPSAALYNGQLNNTPIEIRVYN